jgi:hypothetical protein
MNCFPRFKVLWCALLLVTFFGGCSDPASSGPATKISVPAAPRDLVALGDATKNDAGEVIELNLYGVSFVAGEVEQLRQMKSLKRLTLQECKSFGDADLATVCSLPQLADLSLIRVAVDDASFKHLLAAKSLKKLLLAHTGSIKSGLGYLAELDLTSLGIHNLTITADDLAALPGITSLKELVLQCPTIKIKDIPSLTPLTQLELFNCILMHLGDGGIERLTGLAKLQVLTIDATDLKDDEIAGLNSLADLQELEMVNGSFSDAGLKLLTLPDVQVLGLSGCLLVTDAGLHNLGGFTNLRRLDLMDAGVVGKVLTGLASAPTLELVSMSAGQFQGNNKSLSRIKEILPNCTVEILQG